MSPDEANLGETRRHMKTYCNFPCFKKRENSGDKYDFPGTVKRLYNIVFKIKFIYISTSYMSKKNNIAKHIPSGWSNHLYWISTESEILFPINI